MACEMCGASGNVVRAKIEGVEMDVCSSCASFGQRLSRPVSTTAVRNRRQVRNERVLQERKAEPVDLIVGNYSQLLKQARESMGLKQIELAKRLSLKESQVQHFESGSQEPSLDMAKKLGKFFGISLVETYEPDEEQSFSATSSGPVTIGDMIKIRKKK